MGGYLGPKFCKEGSFLLFGIPFLDISGFCLKFAKQSLKCVDQLELDEEGTLIN